MDKFVNLCLANILRIDAVGQEKIFIISTTNKSYDEQSPYTTPIRNFDGFITTGAVVFSQTQARQLVESIDGKVDRIFVDIEKKIGLTSDYDDIQSDNSQGSIIKSLDYVVSGNISSEVLQAAKQSIVHCFKANDVTVDSIWTMLEYKLEKFDGKKIAVIGAGNIGSKLALKLTESGCNVVIYRRDTYKGHLISQALNIIKPHSTIACVQYVDNIHKACFLADVVIGTTNGVPVINSSHLKGSAKGVTCIDAGKGTFTSDAVSYLSSKKLNIYRADITSRIYSEIASILHYNKVAFQNCGAADFDDIRLVSGGILGNEGDIVVDCYNNISQIYGVADGKGDFKKCLSAEDKYRLEKVKSYFSL